MLIFFVLPEAVDRNQNYIPMIWRGYNLRHSIFMSDVQRPDAIVSQGLLLPSSYVNALKEKAEILKNLKASHKSFAYFTEDNYMLQHSTQIPNNLIYSDSLWESFDQKGYDNLIQKTLENRPEYILFDDPNRRALQPDLYKDLYPNFFARVRESIKEYYQPFQITGGWIIWIKKLEST
jgi:hypothetical protein